MAGLLGKIASHILFNKIFHICYVWIVFKLGIVGWFNCRSRLLMTAVDTGKKASVSHLPQATAQGGTPDFKWQGWSKDFFWGGGWWGWNFLFQDFCKTIYFFWSLIKVGIFWGIQNNLRICDSYIIWCCQDIFMAWKFCNFCPGIFLVLFEAPRTFFGFDFCPYLVIPVTWNPE